MINFRKITPLAVLFSVIIFSNCFAYFGRGEIPENEIALGGLQVRASEARVREIYGEPTEIEYKEIHMGGIRGTAAKTFKYGKGFEIFLMEQKNGYEVWGIKITANNGIKTPAGFGYGSNISDVKKYYDKVGKPDEPGGKIGSKENVNGKTFYKYGKGAMRYLNFEVDSKNKVVGIFIGDDIV